MKVLHIPFCFSPDTVGGTEVYVAQLARDLQNLGADIIVAAPSETNRAYVVDGLSVRRFAFDDNVSDVRQLYGPGDVRAAAEFANILDEETPDLVHMHAFTSAISVRLVETAKCRGIPVVFTYHTPTASCQRGTMLLWGRQFCDGKLDVIRCSGCTLNGLGMYAPLAAIVGRVPSSVGNWLGALDLQGGVWTALRMSELIAMRHGYFREMTSEVSCIVAVCNWVREALLINDIPETKIFLSRHGINWTEDQAVSPPQSSTRDASDETRIVFMGRLERVKGLHILIDAFSSEPTLKLKLDIYGVVQNSTQAAYREEIVARIGDDSRISFREPIESSDVVRRLRHYDFLAIPSQWIETGPLVALEAFAAGIPVIGWNIGGISELVRNEVDGLLIEPDGPGSVMRWAETLRRIAGNTNLCVKLKAGVRPPRTSMDVAREMLRLYQSLLAVEPRDEGPKPANANPAVFPQS